MLFPTLLRCSAKIITERAAGSCSRLGYSMREFITTIAAEKAAIVVRKASNSSELHNSRLATPFATAATGGRVCRNGAAKFILGHRGPPSFAQKSSILRKRLTGGHPHLLRAHREPVSIRNLRNAHRCPEATLLQVFDSRRKGRSAVGFT